MAEGEYAKFPFSAKFTTKATYAGPGTMVTSVQGSLNGFPLTMELFLAPTPVASGAILLSLSARMRRSTFFPRFLFGPVAKLFCWLQIRSVEAGVDIWKRMRPPSEKLISDSGAPFFAGRKWLDQFYTEDAYSYIYSATPVEKGIGSPQTLGKNIVLA